MDAAVVNAEEELRMKALEQAKNHAVANEPMDITIERAAQIYAWLKSGTGASK